MGWLSRLAGLTEHISLDILLNLYVRFGQGVAAIRWRMVRPHLSLSADQSQVALLALLYARTLVIHTESRAELFNRMANAALRVLDGDGELTFDPWELRAGGMAFAIWPWIVTEPAAIPDPKKYTATLQSTTRGSLCIHLRMAYGQERVLAPSAALIGAWGHARTLSHEARSRFARVLLAVNAYYSSPEKFGLRSESAALEVAMPLLRAGETPSRD